MSDRGHVHHDLEAVMRLLVTLVLALVLTVLGAVDARAQDKISISYLVGSSAAPIKVIQAQKLAEKHGFVMDAREFVDIGAMDRAFVLGEHDLISSLSLNTFGEYLNKGQDLVIVLGTLYPHTAIVVPKNAPFKTVADLRGKRVGVYGIHASSTAVFGVIARERYGLDIKKDTQLFGSVPPTLPTLLAKGEVDAILNLPPFVPRMVASGDYRILMTTMNEWESITGSKLPFAFMIGSRKAIEGKRSAVKKMVDAWREAVDYIRAHPEAIDPFLVQAKITDPAGQKIARDIMLPHYMNSLSDKDAENIRLYWDRAVKYGFMTKPVSAQSWYTLDFVK
jgi:ABC-type nitrate/sulfonate/bicarbonate transport system substrate-binding protein